MLSTGEFLQSVPVVTFSHQEKPWEEWLADRGLSRPGFWLADGTDPFPLSITRSLKDGTNDTDVVPADPALLGSIVGLTDELSLGVDLVVHGYWQAADGITVNVKSAIVEAAEANAIAFAVALDEPFHRYLPHEDNYGFNHGQVTGRLITSWTTTPEDRSMGLDRHDPYCASTALSRPRPSDAVIADFGLRSNDVYQRQWLHQNEPVFTAVAWGSTRGTGQSVNEKSGARLVCRVDLLKALLERRKAHLVLLVSAQKYLEGHQRKGEGAFRTETLIVTVCAKRLVKRVWRIPKIVRAAVNSLPTYERSNFESRLIAIRTALSSSDFATK
jgi:hypothetical protein